MWSSQRETMLSDLPGVNLTGNELGLQIWLPFNELEEIRGPRPQQGCGDGR